MSDELCDPNSDFSTVIVSDLILLFSSLISNPLYLSYFIFFSPYLLKLASFLSPLFFTIFVLLLSDIVREKDHQGPDDDDDLGLYETLFGTHLMNCPDEGKTSEGEKTEENQEPGLEIEAKEKRSGPDSELKSKSFPVMEEKRMENFLKILDQFERMSKSEDKPVPAVGVRQNAATKTGVNDVKVKATFSCSVDRDDGVRKEPGNLKDDGVRRIAATKTGSNVDDHVGNDFKTESFRTWDRNSSTSSSFGSMRVEKEWKRTLACKLFEERHSVDGGEGMDSLWEAYEKDSSKPVGKETVEKKKRNKKTSEVEFNVARYVSDRDDEDGDEDEVVGGHLCCLHAIKLSTGKLNLGMGRPNLVKISKAIRGFGWLHHVGKHSKKVHNNNGDRY